MSQFAFLVPALIMAATGVAAQDVTVRSGEHDGYTRLVAQVPPDTGWVLEQTKNGARLNVALDGVTFRTGSVFQRLTEDRLTSISQTEPGAALQMEFGCDCAATAFLFKETMIVVDIAPGRFLPPIPSDIPASVLPKAPEEDVPLTVAQPLDTLALPLLNLNTQAFEEQLAARLLQGADRGIVNLNLAPVGPRASVANQSLPVPPGMEMNINVRSILDELNGLLGPGVPQLERHPPCVTSAELGFEDWADNRPFPIQTAELRSGLFQEFDTLDTPRALKLAKLYAFYGFGAEALRTLDLLATQSPETERVSAIARVLDDGPLRGPNPFNGLQRCDSDAALWAALTEGQLREDAHIIAIEQSFVRLPNHLRRHIGPVLSDILVEAQKLEAARRVLRAVDRIEPQPRPTVTQAKAKIAAAEGDAPSAERLLKDVVSSSDAALEAPLALARLIDKRWSDRGAVSPQELELAASYAVEFRRSEIGPVMQHAHAVALSLGQEFDRAMNVVAAIPNDADGIETINRVMSVLTDRADDATFLRRVLIVPKAHLQALSTDTAIAVAGRLASLRFSEPALALAKRPQDRARRGERARLRARSALLDGRPHQAMLELSDDPSEEAVLLRATAMLATGEFTTAGELLREAGATDRANRVFWLADQPDNADPEDGLKYGRIVQTTQSLTTPPARLPDTPLADAEGLLKDSADTRRRIADLISTVEEQ